MQSGAPLAVDVATATELASSWPSGSAVRSVAALRDVPVADLLAAQTQLEATAERAFVPVVDGVTVPLARPLKTLANGSAAGIPMLIGTNVDEWKLWAAADPHSRDLDEDRLRIRLDARFGDDRAGDVIDAIRDARAARGEGAAPNDVFYAAESERTFRVPSLRMAVAQAGNAPTFAYLFEWGSPAMGGWLGACHGLEIAFVFGNQGRGDLAAFTGAGRRRRRPRRHDDGRLGGLRPHRRPLHRRPRRGRSTTPVTRPDDGARTPDAASKPRLATRSGRRSRRR